MVQVVEDFYYYIAIGINKKELKKAVDSAIKLYNEKRPHMSLEYETPAQRYAA